MKYAAVDLPAYFDKWGVRYVLVDGWETRGRSSGGFDNVFGVQIHHAADKPTTKLETSIRYNTVTGANAPIGNATISRDRDGPVVVLYAGLAANTAGKGGPRMTSRGVIPLDAGNRLSFAFEAENDGTSEPWSDTMCDLYVRATVAVLDWASNRTPGAPLGPGDVFAHFEWAPTRKIDPRGPSRFSPDGGMWDMDVFRGEVFLLMLTGPPSPQEPVPSPEPVNPANYTVQPGDGWWRISRALGFPIEVLQVFNGWPADRVLHPGDVILGPGAPAPSCVQPQVCGPGDSGPVVAELQTLLLADTWYPYTIDGDYGPRTMQGVQQLQLHLRRTGFDPGAIDGVYGEQTRLMLCAFMGTPV